jgi:hypothetical protein
MKKSEAKKLAIKAFNHDHLYSCHEMPDDYADLMNPFGYNSKYAGFSWLDGAVYGYEGEGYKYSLSDLDDVRSVRSTLILLYSEAFL